MTRNSAAQDLARLRVGLVAHAELGGSGTVATELATELANSGHEVHLITPRRPMRLLERSGVVVHEIEASAHPMWEAPPWGLALAGRIADICRAASLDVVHAHFAIPYAASTELAMHILGSEAPPWVLTLHGSDVEALSQDANYATLVRHAIARASATTVPSHYLRRQLVGLGLAPTHLSVIPNFVDSDRFRPSAQRPPPSVSPMLVHVSNFRRIKRIDDVVTIFSNVAAESSASLLLLGDGPELAPALKRLNTLGLGSRVLAPGVQANVQDWLHRGHVALLPSERESFGLAALEALACGLVVVGSDVGGLPEVVQQPETGTLVPVGRTDEMSQAVLQWLSDDAAWALGSDAARSRASAFGPERAVGAYVAQYRAVLARNDST